MRQIIIDRGHDPKYPGARGVKDEVWHVRHIADELIPRLAGKGYQIDVVPDGLGGGSGNGNLINKIKWINAHARPGAWLISLHGDGALNVKARGITIAFYGGSKYAEDKAKKMLGSVMRATKLPAFGSGLLPDTRARFGRLGMIRDTKPMALLVENGFVTNREDMMSTPRAFAEGIANFITANV